MEGLHMSLLRASPDVSCKNLGDESVLFDAASRTAHVVNQTAAEVWRLCDGTRSLAHVARSMGERYPDARDRVAADVEEIVAAFRGLGLLLPETAPAPKG
jgi:hypothetical protein